ncbi:MAG: hypothetical protein Kow0063_16900 [Anaerolineae bacterium]
MSQFIENLKSENAFLLYSGTTALYALLKSIGVGPGDEVIVQSFTCPAVPSPVVRRGATPVYVDIDQATFNMDPAKIADRITNKTKVIIAQHTFGIPADMDSILDIAREHNLWVIEDACHAFGSKYYGREVGTLGDAAIYSFGWYKPIVLGVGGAAIVNNPILKQKMQEICVDWVVPSLKEAFSLYLQYAVYAALYNPSRFWAMKEIYRRLRDFKSGPRKGKIGPLLFGHTWNGRTQSAHDVKSSQHATEEAPESLYPSPLAPAASDRREMPVRRIIPFQERRLFGKLESWGEMVAHQKWIVAQYEESLSQAGFAPLEIGKHVEPVFYKYPVLSDRKSEIFEKAQEMQIEMSDMFGSPLYPAERAANWRALGYKKGMCPIAERVSDKIVALPVHAKVQARQIERTVSLLASFV